MSRKFLSILMFLVVILLALLAALHLSQKSNSKHKAIAGGSVTGNSITDELQKLKEVDIETVPMLGSPFDTAQIISIPGVADTGSAKSQK